MFLAGRRNGRIYGCGSALHHINTFLSDAKALQPVAPGAGTRGAAESNPGGRRRLGSAKALIPRDELTTPFLIQERAEVLDQHLE